MSESKPRTLADVQAGDEIVMVYRTGRMTNSKSDDKVRRAVVTEAKRVNLLITEKWPDNHTHTMSARTWYVRRDTGTNLTPAQTRTAGGIYYGWHAYTVEEWERNERRNAAFRVLERHGIRVNLLSPWYGREIELADLLTAYVTERHTLANIADRTSNSALQGRTARA